MISKRQRRASKSKTNKLFSETNLIKLEKAKQTLFETMPELKDEYEQYLKEKYGTS